MSKLENVTIEFDEERDNILILLKNVSSKEELERNREKVSEFFTYMDRVYLRRYKLEQELKEEEDKRTFDLREKAMRSDYV